MIKRLECGSLCNGDVAVGCEHCMQGSKMVLLVTGKCGWGCFYCPVSFEKKGLDVIYANEGRVTTDEEIIEGLQTGITLWMEELNSLYQQWAALRPEYAQQITAHQEAFMDYYRAQLGIWNAHFGSPSMAALEKAAEMLADHCSELCIILSGAI